MTTLFTHLDYMALPEGYPALLIEGCLVKQPAPKFGHQRIASIVFRKWCDAVSPELVVFAPADVIVDEYNVYQPDVCVLATCPPDDASDIGIPRIACEILSPSTARYDRSIKRARLLDAGVEELWIIDVRGNLIEVFDPLRYRDTPRRTVGNDDVLTSSVFPAFSLCLFDLFARNPR